jgi:hypothetical protein
MGVRDRERNSDLVGRDEREGSWTGRGGQAGRNAADERKRGCEADARCRERLYGDVRAPASPVGATHFAAATQRKARMIWRTERRLIRIPAWVTQQGVRCTLQMCTSLPGHVLAQILAQIQAQVRLAPVTLQQ